jgi:hypothetical protein
MIALPQTSIGRIGLAIGLSLLAHAVILLAPLIELPKSEPLLPPLTARLEPLPRVAAKPAPKPKPKPRQKPAVPEAVHSDAIPAAEEPQIDPEPQPPVAEKTGEEAVPAHPLPRHAELTFIAYTNSGFEIGQARHRLEIRDDKTYTLKAGSNTTGLASVFKTFELDQQSDGTLTAHGLRPARFSETKYTSKGKESLDARFDWQENRLSFSSGNQAPLPEQAQDIISFLYQLSQLPLDQGTLPMYISNGKKLERYELAVGEEEEIQTRLGKLRALPLRKIHAQGEEGQDIWLGLEYRLLPIKIRQIDRNGVIAGEMVISEIRVADE